MSTFEGGDGKTVGEIAKHLPVLMSPFEGEMGKQCGRDRQTFTCINVNLWGGDGKTVWERSPNIYLYFYLFLFWDFFKYFVSFS